MIVLMVQGQRTPHKIKLLCKLLCKLIVTIDLSATVLEILTSKFTPKCLFYSDAPNNPKLVLGVENLSIYHMKKIRNLKQKILFS